MSHTARTERKRVRIHDSALATDAIRDVGWYARCACGWEADRLFRHRADALRAAHEHRNAYRECGQ